MKRGIKILFLLFFIFISSNSSSQEILSIEGKVSDRFTNQPMPYASVYNKSLQKGTITNYQGYFLIQVTEVNDSVFVSFVGYEAQQIMMRANQKFYSVYLEESAQILDEIIIKPGTSVQWCFNKHYNFFHLE
jgi:hypothetical protein